MPIVPAKRAVRGARAPIADQHRRWNASHRRRVLGEWSTRATGSGASAAAIQRSFWFDTFRKRLLSSKTRDVALWQCKSLQTETDVRL